LVLASVDQTTIGERQSLKKIVLRSQTLLSNKAVADGAVSYFIDHLVSSRVSRFTYGTECSVPFNPFDMEHRARQKDVFRSASGILALPRAFSSILTKVAL
jgi:hypothetical protein